LTGLTGFTGFRMTPGKPNPVIPVHPAEKDQRHSAAQTPIPSKSHRFFHVVSRHGPGTGSAITTAFGSWVVWIFGILIFPLTLNFEF
jgi:hypothetical protein